MAEAVDIFASHLVTTVYDERLGDALGETGALVAVDYRLLDVEEIVLRHVDHPEAEKSLSCRDAGELITMRASEQTLGTYLLEAEHAVE